MTSCIPAAYQLLAVTVLCSEEHQLARAELHSQLQLEVERREGLEAEVSGNKEELRHLRWPQSSTELQTELLLSAAGRS